ncbi:glucose-6-phosphate isomerase [Natronospira bacteriovora]|uniref:Glucose-6-phosphate isomerase n=1 Tax=Natronospira bacteriovora TaxID=3069753 RepID=A0ABU0W7F8_9GAMM|nr:glucose-6-phosphate isomerase [Natronospira sp. AB-CW4]MDQ2069400.1 glucose-6-phosphate isomerase [Natronospira sp. AB-CW4]
MRRDYQSSPAASGADMEWLALAEYWRGRSLAGCFQEDPERARRYRADVAGLHVDWSRQFIDEASRDRLLGLADGAGFHAWREALFAGEPINRSEGRPALHMALRGGSERDWRAAGEAVSGLVARELEAMAGFVESLHHGRQGAGGKPIRHVVNIGIGGSHLGPEMLVKALPAAEQAPAVHFLSNVDPDQADRLLGGLDPAETLFLIVSKTFTSKETMENAAIARRWIAEALGEEAVATHFAAVSTAPDKVAGFGIPADSTFRFWDWVGGRYSLWSAAGLAAVVHLGMPAFRALLEGAAEMDRHFEQAPDQENLPLLLGLLDVQSVSAFGWPVWAVVPYADRLRLLPHYLQQLVMESNGKSVNQDGQAVSIDCAPVLLGGIGTDAQHAFFQLLHQGPSPVPVDFIAAARPAGSPDESAMARHRILLANCLAQGEALCHGRLLSDVEMELAEAGVAEEVVRYLAPQKAFPGNRPSNLILMESMGPRTLGALIALYEHRVFVQACLWGINPFDQMGVELGKQLAKRAETFLDGTPDDQVLDPAMRQQMGWLSRQWNRS